VKRTGTTGPCAKGCTGLSTIPSTANCAGPCHDDFRRSHRAPASCAPRRVFARYGNFTLGGGSATAILHHELIGKRRWLAQDRFMLCFALGRLTSGTNLLAFCTGVGWLLRGMSGAVVPIP
jgi:Chromate transporter